MRDPMKTLPGYALRRASAAMSEQLSSRLEALGLRTVEATVLFVIRDNPGATQSAIGRLLSIQRANMTPLAARLEEAGLIERRKSDGRSLGLMLSAHGETVTENAWRVARGHEADLLARVPEAHRAHLLPALRALWAQDAG